MTSDCNVHTSWTRRLCRLERPRADPGSEPISPAARTQRRVPQSGCQYTYKVTATGMVSQPTTRNRWRQNCQTEAT
jgi:hypothetical protein